MKILCTSLFVGVSLLCAQPAETKSASAVKPTTVVAEMNGKPITAAEFEQIIAVMPADVRMTAMRDPENFFKQYAHFRRILDIAEKEHFTEQSPIKERLIEMNRQWIVNSRVDHVRETVKVSPEEQQAFYDAHLDNYRAARVKMIALSFSPEPSEKDPGHTETETRTKALGLVQQARAGADFAKLARENSEDPSTRNNGGDLGIWIRSNTAEVPAALRRAILPLKVGEVSDPIRVDRGYYVVKVISVNTLPYDDVKDEVYQAIKQAAVDKFLADTKKESSFKVENADFFKNFK